VEAIRELLCSLFVRHLSGACIMTLVSRTVRMLVWTRVSQIAGLRISDVQIEASRPHTNSG